MHIDWWTVGLQTINILVLVWLLGKFFFPPLARLIDERQQKARALLEEATQEREKARAEKAAAQAERDEIARTRAALLESAQAEAEAARHATLERAHADAETLREAERQRIATETDHRHALLSRSAAALATDIAARLLSRLPAEAQVAGFVDGLAQALAALPDPASSPLRIVAARPLTAEEQDHIAAALAPSNGRRLDLAFESDPSILAGLEAYSDHLRVANSFRADLETIARTLIHEPVAA